MSACERLALGARPDRFGTSHVLMLRDELKWRASIVCAALTMIGFLKRGKDKKALFHRDKWMLKINFFDSLVWFGSALIGGGSFAGGLWNVCRGGETSLFQAAQWWFYGDWALCAWSCLALIFQFAPSRRSLSLARGWFWLGWGLAILGVVPTFLGVAQFNDGGWLLMLPGVGGPALLWVALRIKVRLHGAASTLRFKKSDGR